MWFVYACALNLSSFPARFRQHLIWVPFEASSLPSDPFFVFLKGIQLVGWCCIFILFFWKCFWCFGMWFDTGAPTDSFYEVRAECSDVPKTRFKIKVCGFFDPISMLFILILTSVLWTIGLLSSTFSLCFLLSLGIGCFFFCLIKIIAIYCLFLWLY